MFGGILSFHSLNNDLAGLSLPEKSLLRTLHMPSMPIYNTSDPGDAVSDFASPEMKFGLINSFVLPDESLSAEFVSGENYGLYQLKIRSINKQGQWNLYNKLLTLDASGLKPYDKR